MSSTCSICLATTADNGKPWVTLSHCGHTFHAECLEQARCHSQRCPNCRARIYDNETDRDRTTLKKNLPIQIHLDVTGSQPCGDSSQLPLSQEADQHRQELAAARRKCWQLEESLDQAEATRLTELQHLNSTLAEARAAAQAGEAQLAVARKEALQQKRSLQQQLKDERSERQTAQTRVESLQAQLDRQLLLSDGGIPREDLLRIAGRHAQGGQVQIFVDAMQRRQDLNNKLMTDRQRDAMRWEQQHSRDEARIADRDTEIAQLKRQLQAEAEVRAAAEQRAADAEQRAADAASNRQSASHRASQGPGAAEPARPDSSRHGSGVVGDPGAQQAGDEDDFLDLEGEVEGEEAARPPLRAVAAGSQFPHLPGPASFLNAGGPGSFLGCVAPRMSEPSFMRGSTCTSSSGAFIREGPDGRGGRVKVLGAANHVRPFSAPPTKRPAFQAPPIKRRKGPSSRGGQAMTIDMFMEKEDDSSRQSR